MKKRIFSLFLVFALCLSLLPGTVWAEDTPAAEQSQETADPEVNEETGGEDEVVGESANVAKVGDTEYATFADAVAAAKDGGTVILLQDVTITGKQLTIDGTETLDLNGYTVKVSGYTAKSAQVSVTGTLTLQDSSEAGTGKICSDYTGTAGVVVQVEKNGRLILEGGTITTEGMAKSGNALKIAAGGTVEMTGGTIKCDAKRGNRAVNITGSSAAAEFTMTGGSVVAEESNDGETYIIAIVGASASKIAISGNSVVSGPQAVSAPRSETAITGGTFAGTVEAKAGSITGGSFDRPMPASALEPGHIPVKNDGSTYGVSAETYVALVGDADNGYATLQEAINAAQNGEAVTLLQDTKGDITVSNKEITLNLNSKTLTNSASHTITVNSGATLTINGAGTVDNITHGKAALVNYGTVTLDKGVKLERSKEAGTLEPYVNGGNSYYTVLNDQGGEMTINNATVENKGGYSSAIRNGGDDKSTAKSVMTINAGTFSGGINAVKNDEYGVLVINNGTFSNSSQYVIMNWNEATINKGTFSAKDSSDAVLQTAAWTPSGERSVGKLTITGGTFNRTGTQAMIEPKFVYAGKDYAGVATVTGGTFGADVTEFLADGYELYRKDNGNYVAEKSENAATKTVAQIGNINYHDFSAALKNAVGGDTIKLLQDVSTSSLKAGLTYDLNGYKLTYTSGTSFTYENSTTSFIDSSVSGTARGGTLYMSKNSAGGAGIVVGTGATLNIQNIKVESAKGEGFFPKGDAAQVNVTNSDMKANWYCIGTNAATTDNYNVEINLKGSTFTSCDTTYNDGTAVYINVAGTLNIDDCELTSKRQAVMVRAGTANITNSTLKTTGQYANKDQYHTGKWGSGNEVPAAALVIGNYVDGAADSYKADAIVTVKDTKLIAESDFPALYVDGNTAYKSDVSLSGDMVVSGAVMKGQQQAAGAANISITGGTFSTDVSAYTAEGFGCYQNAVSDGLYRVGVKQVVAIVTADKIQGVTEDNKTAIEGALASIKNNAAANNFAGHGAEDVTVSEEVKKDLTDQGATIDEDTAIITTISVTTTAMTVDENAKVTNVTYEVTPIAKVTVGAKTYTAEIENPGQTLTFRLPIPFEAKTVKVSHNGTYFGTYNVLGDAATGRYIELSSNTFSPWTVENVTGGTTGGVTPPPEKPKVCPRDETCPIEPFTDTANDFWWHDGIHYCLEHGLMVGVGDDLFAPNGTTTRAMIVTILWRLEGSPAVNYAMSFRDVAEEQWYTEPIRWAQSTGMVLGYSDEAFGPNDNITREQLAAILHRYANGRGIDTAARSDLAQFTDTDEISVWAVDNLRWANAAGLVSGRTETTLVPRANATRAEAACMIQRFCENVLELKWDD